MSYVRTLDEIGTADAGTSGELGASLGEMRRAGLPVPPGFCLSSEAYRIFMGGEYVDKTVRRILAGLQVGDPEDVDVRTEQVRNFLNAQQVPAFIAQQVLQSYYNLSFDLGSVMAPVPVAVRTSPTSSDPFGLDCAGPRLTFLNVSGEADLLEHVKRCWGSLWSAQAVARRVREGIDHAQVGLAVIVQGMVQAEASGILFTASPFANTGDEVLILAVWGLSPVIVTGLGAADAFRVRKRDGAIIGREIAIKDRMVECAHEGGTFEREVPEERRCVPAISDALVAEVFELGRRIDKLLRAPTNMEWACAEGRVFICDVGVMAKDRQMSSGVQLLYQRTLSTELDSVD